MPMRMQSCIPIPKPLNVRVNLAQNWREFRQVWNSNEILTKLQSLELMKYRVVTFITCVGHDALCIYNSLQFEEEDHKRDIDLRTGSLLRWSRLRTIVGCCLATVHRSRTDCCRHSILQSCDIIQLRRNGQESTRHHYISPAQPLCGNP